jgi:hypothetical protein
MNKNQLLEMYKGEEQINFIKIELTELKHLQNSLALRVINLEEKLIRTEKDFFVWVNVFTNDLKEGKKLDN